MGECFFCVSVCLREREPFVACLSKKQGALISSAREGGEGVCCVTVSPNWLTPSLRDRWWSAEEEEEERDEGRPQGLQSGGKYSVQRVFNDTVKLNL